MLDKIASSSNPLGNICEVNQGVLSGADTLTDKHIEKFGKLGDKSDGIFVLDLKNTNDLEFYNSIPESEKNIIRPFYKNSNIEKYKTISFPTKFIIYITKKTKIENYPIILNYLEKFKLILQEKRETKNGKLPWYSLHWTRNQSIFDGEKIIVPYRSSTNTFGYSNNSCYFRTDAYSIIAKNKDYSNKFLLGVLNSKLIYKWLKIKGKNKGEILELFYEPLSKIPIPILDTPERQLLATQIEELVEEILQVKNTPTVGVERSLGVVGDDRSNTTELESQIDTLVYQLYDLTAEEIAIVEG